MSTRSTPAGVTTPYRSTSSAEPVVLVEIPTGLTSPATLRYATTPYAVTWNALTWSPLPLVPISGQFDSPGSSSQEVLVVGDVDLTIATLIEAGAVFEGQTVVQHRTDLSATGGAGADAVSDEYVIESVELEEGAVRFLLRDPLGTIDKRLPGRKTTRALFPGLAMGPLY